MHFKYSLAALLGFVSGSVIFLFGLAAGRVPYFEQFRVYATFAGGGVLTAVALAITGNSLLARQARRARLIQHERNNTGQSKPRD